MVDLNDVALFVRIWRAGSFAEAARRADVPISTVSRRLKQLEERLGLRLLHRSTRRLTLTGAGETFYARCADQIDSVSDAATELAQGSESPSGRVRVSAAVDFFAWFKMDWVTEFLADHPKVKLEFRLGDGRESLVAEGIDVAIRAGKVCEPTLVARPVGIDRAVLVASPHYLALRGTPRSPDELGLHDCVAMTASCGRTLWQLDGPQGKVHVQVGGRVCVNSEDALLSAARAGLGIGLLPEAATAADLRSGRLVQILPAYGLKGVDVNLVYLSRRQLPSAVRAFIEFAIARIVAEGLVRSATGQSRGWEPQGTEKANVTPGPSRFASAHNLPS